MKTTIITREDATSQAKKLYAMAESFHNQLDDLWECIRYNHGDPLKRIDSIMFYGHTNSGDFTRAMDDFTDLLYDLIKENDALRAQNKTYLEATEHLGEYLAIKERLEQVKAIVNE